MSESKRIVTLRACLVRIQAAISTLGEVRDCCEPISDKAFCSTESTISVLLDELDMLQAELKDLLAAR